MVLQPLEFSECYLDSPWFRQSVHEYEVELERTNSQIKQLMKDAKNWLNASRTQGKMMQIFSNRLQNFQFDIIGEKLTDDEKGIASSLKEFGVLLNELETEWTRTIDRAEIQLVKPLESFRKEHIHSYRDAKKMFDKNSERYYKQMDHALGLSYKKKEQLQQEHDNELLLQKRNFHRTSLHYVYKLQEVQEKKKFEFVEHLLMFMQVYFHHFRQCDETAIDCREYMNELQMRLQSTREQYEGTKHKTESLMRKMADCPDETNGVSPVRVIGQRWARAGYLLLQEKNPISSRFATKWTRYFCMYTKENKLFQMLHPFSTSANPIGINKSDAVTTTQAIEPMIVHSCVGRNNDTIDKRFCFDITVEESATGKQITLTLQGISASDKNKWLRVMDGKEPEDVKPKQSYYKKLNDYRNKDEPFDLNETSIRFVENVIAAIERRGLEAEGIYRLVGVSSKVDKILQIVLDKDRSESFNYDDESEWELNTLTSALKNFFRNLPEPIMTFDLHRDFIEAAKHEDPEERLKKVKNLVSKLNSDSQHILKVLIQHLRKVTTFSNQNKMVSQNLGVCFGPTLMRPKEETVASIMEIKFNNIIVEILIENYAEIFGDSTEDSTEQTLIRKRKDMGRLPSQRFKSRPHGVYDNPAVNISEEDISIKPVPSPNIPRRDQDSRFVRGHAFRGTPGKSISPRTQMKLAKNEAPIADVGDDSSTEEETSDGFGSMTKLDLDIQIDGLMHGFAQTSALSPLTPGGGDYPSIADFELAKTTEGDSNDQTYVNLLPKTQPLNPAPNDRVNKEKWEVKETVPRSPSPLPRKHRGSSLKSLNRNSSDSEGKRVTNHPVNRKNKQRRSISDSRKVKPTMGIGKRWNPNENNNNNSGGSLVESAKEKLMASLRSSQSALSGKSLRKKAGLSTTKKRPPVVKPKPALQRPMSYHPQPTQTNIERSPKPSRAFSEKIIEAKSDTEPDSGRNEARSFLWPKPGSMQKDTFAEPRGKPESIARSSAVLTRQNTAVQKAKRNLSTEASSPKQEMDVIEAELEENLHEKEFDSGSESDNESETDDSSSQSSFDDFDQPEHKVATTLYACEGEHDNELSFQPGQIIFNVQRSKEPGWLTGSLNGRIGLIPENYVTFNL